jgi:hypothetical protein
MVFKSIKCVVAGGLGLALLGGVMFGTDFGSYITSSAKSVRVAVQDQVPMDFELKRARDLLDEIIPEMQANIRLIAQQEVEIAALREDVIRSDKALAEEKTRVGKLRNCLDTTQTSFAFNGLNYSREQLKEELSRRFERFREAEMVLGGKRRLLDNREKSLNAGMLVLDRTRSQKQMLENQIEAVEAQFRLVEASSVGSKVNIDNSKLAQTEKLIAQLKKKLDVAERVLAHEAKFTESIPVGGIEEKDLLVAVDEHFATFNIEKPEPKADSVSRADSNGR